MDWHNEDLKNLMRKNEFDFASLERCISLLENNKKEAVKEIKKILNIIEINTAQESLRVAKNFKITKEIYLSDEVSSTFQNVFKELYSAWVDINLSETDAKRLAIAAAKLNDVVPALMEAFRRSVRKELRIENV